MNTSKISSLVFIQTLGNDLETRLFKGPASVPVSEWSCPPVLADPLFLFVLVFLPSSRFPFCAHVCGSFWVRLFQRPEPYTEVLLVKVQFLILVAPFFWMCVFCTSGYFWDQIMRKHRCFLWLASNTELLVAVWMTLSLLAILVTTETVDKNIVETNVPLLTFRELGRKWWWIINVNNPNPSEVITVCGCLQSSRHTVVFKKYIKVNVQYK